MTAEMACGTRVSLRMKRSDEQGRGWFKPGEDAKGQAGD